MDAEQKQLLAEAVNCLIEEVDAPTLHKQLMGVYEVARKNIPVRLTGRPAVLNPILDLLCTNQPAGERVLQLVDRKRTEHGLEPLVDAAQERREYMRELMAQRRERLRRLVELWNMPRPEVDKLRGTARAEFERQHGNRWFAVRDEREKAMRERLGRRLTGHERRDLIARFWADVNDELDALEEFVRNQIRAGGDRRATFDFKLKPKQ